LCISLNVSAQIPTKGLIGYWPFEGNAKDESKNSNHGTVYNATLTTDRFGHKDSAYAFDGNGDYINVGSSSTLKTPEHTINYWLKRDNSSGFQSIISCLNSLSGEWGAVAYINSSGVGYGIAAGSNDHMMGHSSDKKLLDNQWHMVTCIFDKATQVISFYVDGCYVGTQNYNGSRGGFSGSDEISFRSAEDFIFGAASQYFSSSNNNGPQWYKGALDDIRIYDRAISPLEVKQLMFEGVKVFDTITVFDTTFVNVYDTTNVFDTTFTTIFDTTFLSIYDTMTFSVFDTTNIYDTIRIRFNDTTYHTIYDTLFFSVADTLHITIPNPENSDSLSHLRIYPNPSKDHVWVDFGKDWNIDGNRILIFNIVGQKLLDMNVNSRLEQIDISSFAVGHYILTILDTDNNVLVTKRLVLHPE